MRVELYRYPMSRSGVGSTGAGCFFNVLTIFLLHLSSGNSRAEQWQVRFEREFPGIAVKICPE